MFAKNSRMRAYINISIFALLLASCSKSNEVPISKEKYIVNFDVKANNVYEGFERDYTNVSSSNSQLEVSAAEGDTLKNYVNNLYYQVYNSSWQLVSSVVQKSTSFGFGSIADSLPMGNYHVIFAASKSPMSVGFNRTIWTNNNGPWDDTFAKKIELFVGPQNSAESIRLDRIVGGIEVILLDTIPVNTTQVTITFKDGIAFNINDLTNYAGSSQFRSVTKSFSLASSDVGKKKKFLMYVGNITDPETVTIRAYKGTVQIAQKVVLNVRCFRNRKTTLIGNLFTNEPSSSVASRNEQLAGWEINSAPFHILN